MFSYMYLFQILSIALILANCFENEEKKTSNEDKRKLYSFEKYVYYTVSRCSGVDANEVVSYVFLHWYINNPVSSCWYMYVQIVRSCILTAACRIVLRYMPRTNANSTTILYA